MSTDNGKNGSLGLFAIGYQRVLPFLFTLGLTAACGDSLDSDPVGTFMATIADPDSSSFEGQAVFGSDLGNGTPGWGVQLQEGNSLGDYNFIHVGRIDGVAPEVGTYPIVHDTVAAPQDFVARYQGVALSEDGFDHGEFFYANSGTLEITSVTDDIVEGSFTFTAQGQDSSDVVTVSAPFSATRGVSRGNATLEGNWLVTWYNAEGMGSPSAALTLGKPWDLVCDSTFFEGSCKRMYVRNDEADWSLHGSYGDNMAQVYYPITPDIQPGGVIKISHPYFVLGYWGGESNITQAGPNTIVGAWHYGEDEGGREIWRRAVPAVERVRFLSDIESEIVFGEGTGIVVDAYDSFWWGPENDMRGNRPEFWVEIYGQNFWGNHVAYVEGGPDIELVGLRPIYGDGESGELFNIIGLTAAVKIWEHITMGPKYLVVDGISIPFEFVVNGHPSSMVTDTVVNRAAIIVEEVEAGEASDTTDAARRIMAILDSYGGEDPEVEEIKNLIALLLDREELIDSGELETLIDKILNATDRATTEEGLRELRDEILERAANLAALMANGEYSGEDATRLLNIAKYGAQAIDDANDLPGALTGSNTSGATKFLATAYGVAATMEGVRTGDGEMLVDGVRDVVSQLPGMDTNPITGILDIPAEVTASMIGVTRDGFEEATGALEAIAAAIGGDESALNRALEHSRNIEQVLSGENYGNAMQDAITNRIIDKIPFARTVVSWFTSDDN
ncbi:MAG: hypothetical protein OEZ54_05160 [Gemmatimonadota bacterium]|nr:hypothetical protein [Gemmatimonadota bacterium]